MAYKPLTIFQVEEELVSGCGVRTAQQGQGSIFLGEDMELKGHAEKPWILLELFLKKILAQRGSMSNRDRVGLQIWNNKQ